MPTLIPIKYIKKHCNPFLNNPWELKSFTRKHIAQAIKENRFFPGICLFQFPQKYHIERVAYLVVNPAKDPIEIDVGVPSLGCNIEWFVNDGNHRLAAAIYSNKTHILAEVSGDVDYAKKLFKVNCSE